MKFSSKIFLILIFFSFSNFNAQKNLSKEKKKYNYVLTTSNTDDIEEFLATANPEDPRYPLCKHRLVELKNKKWMKNGPISFMVARPVATNQELKPKFLKLKKPINEDEFAALIKENQQNHNFKTIKLLNALFNPDLKSDEKIVLVRNHSSCNIVLSLNGEKFIKLAIPAKGEEFTIIKKGDYNLEANICGIAYKSNKNFQNSQILILEEPVMVGMK